MFRGREVTHPERGQMILDRLAEELTELAIIEQRPNLDGRNMTMLLGPSKAVLSGTLGKDGEDAAGAENGEGEAPEAMATATVDEAIVEAEANGAEPVAVDEPEPEADDDAEPDADGDVEPAAAADDEAEPAAEAASEPAAQDDAEPAA
jgi:translation initiation factor IF-3